MDDTTEYTGPSNIGTTRWNPQIGVYYKGASTKPSYRPTMTPDIVGRYVLARDYADLAAKLAEVEASRQGWIDAAVEQQVRRKRADLATPLDDPLVAALVEAAKAAEAVLAQYYVGNRAIAKRKLRKALSALEEAND